MAKPSVCKVCGQAHWLNQPHVFKPTGYVDAGLPSEGEDALEAYLKRERKARADYMRAYRARLRDK